MNPCHYRLYKPIECTTQRVNLNVNYELWVIMMCQYRFINCKICTSLVGGFDHGEGYASAGEGSKWEISVTSSQLCCEPKTTFKN